MDGSNRESLNNVTKKKLKLTLYLIFLIVIWTTCKPSQPEKAHTRRDRASDRIDSITQHFYSQGNVMGFAIAVMQNEDTLYNKAFGYEDTARNTPVTTQSYFRIASVSKLIGATLILKLVDQEKLHLDDKLIDLLPDYPNKTHGEKITLRHLLSHTSGLPDYAAELDSIYIKEDRGPSKAEYYQFFATHELLFEPGTYWTYSNSGFVLLPFIIEKAAGKSFEQYIDEVYNESHDLDFKLVEERFKNKEILPHLEYNRTDSTFITQKPWEWIRGDGGITTTAINLAHFPTIWADGKIISKAAFKEMTEPIVLQNGIETGYGLGVRTGLFEDDPVIGHTGGHHTSFAQMMYFPEKEITIVVLVNTDKTNSDAITIIGHVALQVLGLSWPNLKEQEKKQEELSRFVGDYQYYEYGSTLEYRSYYLSKEDSHLHRKGTGSDSKGEKLYYLGNAQFAPEHYPMDRIVFVKDSTGQVVAYKDYWNGFFQRMGFKNLP